MLPPEARGHHKLAKHVTFGITHDQFVSTEAGAVFQSDIVIAVYLTSVHAYQR